MKKFDWWKLLSEKKYLCIVAVGLIIGGFYIWNSAKPDNQEVLKTPKISHKKAAKPVAAKNSKFITVDIFGAINKQGVYQIEGDKRLNDLIAIAGGLSKDADIKNINRAKTLSDQEKVYIPYIGEIATSTKTDSGGLAPSDSDNEKVNLNSADASELQKLNGIGEKKAEQIISYRDENGPFKDPKDLTKVSGIGDKTFEAMADKVTVWAGFGSVLFDCPNFGRTNFSDCIRFNDFE